ncbi:hypothetical protein [Marinobacter sp.]|uniref:hypothetical protein n=1 Tax=Marinobacter sp. TaxID=50741 RepID=UPI002B275DAD|nr:hypothetical protein [Marinobacter sp.]
MNSLHPRAFAAVLLTATLTGCGDSSSSSEPIKPAITEHFGVIATASDDFQSGEVELVATADSGMTASGGYFGGISDIAVNGHGEHYYLIRKFNGDQVLKVDIKNPGKEVWEASTLASGEQGTANPYQLVFVNESKAYLLRYGKNTAWIVNPSATQADDFFTGETLDLSHYMPAQEDSIGAVNMSAGVVVNGKLFITLQRLDGNYEPTNTAYVAVFNTETDTEIDTQTDLSGNLKGIPLQGKNPGNIQLLDGTGLIVTNLGGYSSPFTGTSLDVIDPASYQVTSMLADADVDFQINDAVIISENQGYILSYAGWKDVSLQSFDPSQGASSLQVIGGLTGSDFRDIELSPQGRLWMADASPENPGVRVINPADNSQDDFIKTSLLPIDISFGTVVTNP